MSATKQQRLAKGMRWAARVIGLGGIAFYLLCLFASWLFNDPLIRSSTAGFFSNATVVIALAGCFLSWWREWLAGILLIISWLTSLGVVICAIGHYGDDAVWWLCYGSPLLVAGLLLLLSWWLSRKTL